jgi:hypothetical protein
MATTEQDVRSQINDKVKLNKLKLITGPVLNNILNLIVTFISEAISTISLTPGADAPQVKIQYSLNATDWHADYADGDKYIRISTDNGSTWGSALLFKGLDGINGANGTNGTNGADGKNAFEVWKTISGNENKTLNDYWLYLATVGGFNINLALDTDTSILFSSPKGITITSILLTNADSITYSINGGTEYTTGTGTVQLSISANSIVKFKIVYSANKTQAIINISGTYN